MRCSHWGNLVLAGLFLAAGNHSRAQGQNEPGSAAVDLGITYSIEHAQLAPGTCGCFWPQGGEADVAMTVWKGFGIAGALSGETVTNYAPGIDFSKLSYMGGPRFTYTPGRRAAEPRLRFQIFGEGLFGSVHGLHGAFPSGGVTRTTADAFSLQTGGGLNLFFSRRLGVRLLEVEYVRTRLPNSYANTQNDLRLGFGISYHAASFHLHR